jgi:hypothetical protein
MHHLVPCGDALRQLRCQSCRGGKVDDPQALALEERDRRLDMVERRMVAGCPRMLAQTGCIF